MLAHGSGVPGGEAVDALAKLDAGVRERYQRSRIGIVRAALDSPQPAPDMDRANEILAGIEEQFESDDVSLEGCTAWLRMFERFLEMPLAEASVATRGLMQSF